MNVNKTLILALATVSFLVQGCVDEKDALSTLPIQYKGRVQSFEGFSRHHLKLITGRQTWQKKSAVVTLNEFLSHPTNFVDEPWIQIEFPPLKEALGLDSSQRKFSYGTISIYRSQIEDWVRSSQSKREQDIRPSAVEQKSERLYAQLRAIEDLISGQSLLINPPDEGETWNSRPGQGLPQDLRAWINQVHQKTQKKHEKKIFFEVLYLKARPFQYAALLYLIAFVLLALAHGRPLPLILGFTSLIVALNCHTVGLILRVFILGRPPVSNMYESMIFMNWALVIFAILFSFFSRSATASTCGALASGLIMLYSHLLPLNTGLDVLVPVLRSNYWLTIHVMTIVSSYGAFGLALALGHRYLFCEKGWSQKSQKSSAQLLYRVMQVGIILLGTGTVLGGVWANESWGRFWGWDPKETWALITFLGYLLIVHLKYAKKISGRGLAAGSILGFMLVLMTWYGVNFVLGRGLHSYGFGSGGLNWILFYLAAELLFLICIFGKDFSAFFNKTSR